MKEITVQDLKRMRDQGEAHQLVDVREPHEYEEVNIGGEPIPMGTIPENLEKLRKDIPLILQCRSGARSGNVTQFLEKQGFQNVHNLKGGILAWIEQIAPQLGKS
jgi:sulfur-carrier protein adenylyltransferase/sulfurtransferase